MNSKKNKITMVIVSILIVLFVAAVIVIVLFAMKIKNPIRSNTNSSNSNITKTDNQKINEAQNYSNQATESIISNNTAAATTQLQESSNLYKSVSNKDESAESASDSVKDESQMLNSVPKVTAPTNSEPVPGIGK
jgi:predicted PurR-regulated permease PerM